MFSTKRKLSRVRIFWSVCLFKGQSKLIVDVNKILLCKGLCNASSIVRLTISSTPRIILQNFTNIIFSNDTNQLQICLVVSQISYYVDVFHQRILQCCSGASHLRGNPVTCTPRVFRVHFSCSALLQNFV